MKNSINNGNHFFSKDSEEIRTMYNPSNKTEILIRDQTAEIIGKLFNSFLQRYQKIQNKQ